MVVKRFTVAAIRSRIGFQALKIREYIGISRDLENCKEDAHYPASFSAWRHRRELQVKSNLAETIKSSVPAEQTYSRIGVVVHVESQTELNDVLMGLANIPVDFDLFVTTFAKERLTVEGHALSSGKKIALINIPNQGRDVLPLISLINAELLDPYELILKIRSKDSLSCLLDSTKSVKNALNCFATDPSLGILVSPGTLRGPREWAQNQILVKSLMKRLQLEFEPDLLQFPSEPTYWIRSFLLQGLRALEMSEWDFEDEAGQTQETTVFSMHRIMGLLALEAGYEIRESVDCSEPQEAWKRFGQEFTRVPRARIIPLYDTRFHIEDGISVDFNSFWGDVAAARPSVSGQLLPLLPEKLLGFYDLSLNEVRREQYRLAVDNGIEAFMYGFRWGKKDSSMPLPLRNHLLSGESGSFCLHWINAAEENSLFLDGLGQDPRKIIGDLLPYLQDIRYLRIAGVPLLVVSGLHAVIDLESVISSWRKLAEEKGCGEILIAAMYGETWSPETGRILCEKGVDFFIQGAAMRASFSTKKKQDVSANFFFHGEISDYGDLAKASIRSFVEPDNPKFFPCVLVNQDDTATQKTSAQIALGANPYTFRRWFDAAVSSVSSREKDQRVAFIDSWNAWLTTSVLEPSLRYGKTYLLAVRDVLFR